MPAKVKCGRCKNYIKKEEAVRRGIQNFCFPPCAALVSSRVQAKSKTKRKGMPEGLREEVLSRDGGRCVLCGSRDSLHVHHVRYRSEGGPDERSNLVTLCGWHHNLGTDCVHSNKAKWQPILQEYLRKRERG